MAATLIIQTANLMNDAEDLVSQVRQGDHAAFRLIFERHHRLVSGFLYSMVGSYDLTEELTQETFIGAYKNIDSLRDETKLATWLCGIARNIACNYFRDRRAAGETTEISEQVIETLPSGEMAPDSRLLTDELNSVIREAMCRLDEDKRMVFTLKILQNLSYAEIAEITGFTIPKLKTDLHRAKAEMRRLINPYMETE